MINFATVPRRFPEKSSVKGNDFRLIPPLIRQTAGIFKLSSHALNAPCCLEYAMPLALMTGFPGSAKKISGDSSYSAAVSFSGTNIRQPLADSNKAVTAANKMDTYLKFMNNFSPTAIRLLIKLRKQRILLTDNYCALQKFIDIFGSV